MHFAELQLSNEHRWAAAARSTGDDFIMQFAAAEGISLHSESMSPKDINANLHGQRLFYYEKDLRMPARFSILQPHQVVKLIDVDMHMSANELTSILVRSAGVMMYTVIPEHLCYETQDGLVTVDDKGIYTEGHLCATPYSHPLWDWNIDYFTICSASGFLHCYVERRKVAENRFVVFIIPTVRGGLLASLVWLFLGDTRPLRRWNPNVHPELNMLCTNNTVVLARPSGRAEHLMTNAQFSELRAIEPKKLSSPAIMRVLNEPVNTQYELMGLLTILASITETQPLVHTTILPPVQPPTTVRYYGAEYIDLSCDIRHKGSSFMKPLIDSAFAAVASKANDLHCIDARLESLQKIRTARPHKRFYTYVTQFVETLAGGAPHSLVPLDIQDVYEHASVGQAKKYANALTGPLDVDVSKSFQKSETYSEVKAPRNISCVDPKHVAQSLRFVIPFVKYLKDTCKWYCFGLSPEEISDRVTLIANNAFGELVEGDFTRFDGTYITIFVDLLLASFMKMYPHQYHDELRSLRYRLCYLLFVTENGVKYNSRDSQKSGGANTSCDNTTVHAFVQFCHYCDLGYTPEIAWRMIGMCAGDDGLLRTTDPEGYVKTCAGLHLVVKTHIRRPGDAVGFCGRIWPNPFRDNLSFADPYRALSRFHYSDSSDPNIVNELKAWRKAIGYFTTDSGNIVGLVADHVMHISAVRSADIGQNRLTHLVEMTENNKLTTDKLREKFLLKPIYPGFNAGPSEFLAEQCDDPSLLYFCNQVNLPLAYVQDWLRAVLDCQNLNELPTLMRTELPIDLAVATSVDGVLIGPPLGKAPIPPVRVDVLCPTFFYKNSCPKTPNCRFSHDKTKVCKDFAIGTCKRTKCKFRHVPLAAAMLAQ
nr:MAG: RNA-dependent RNA polymerase [Crogonang virus 71]